MRPTRTGPGQIQAPDQEATPTMPATVSVGFLGLGAMGKGERGYLQWASAALSARFLLIFLVLVEGMATNLQRFLATEEAKGFDPTLSVWNRSAVKLKPLLDIGR